MHKNYFSQAFVFIFLCFLVSACMNDVNSTSEIKKDGKSLYEQNCVICHGKDGKLKAAASKDLSVSVLSKELVIQTIQKGSPQKGMPSYENRLNPIEIEEISEYILKLRK